MASSSRARFDEGDEVELPRVNKVNAQNTKPLNREQSQPELLCRRFGYLHRRTLLSMQDELCTLERELQELDDAENELYAARDRHIGDRCSLDGLDVRKGLLETIDYKLSDYNDLIREAYFTLHRTQTTCGDYTSLEDWLRRGPHFLKDQQNSEHFWVSYSAVVNAILLDPVNSRWLKGPVSIFLTPQEQLGRATSRRRTTTQRRLHNEPIRYSQPRIESDLERGPVPQSTGAPSGRYQQRLKDFFQSELFVPLSTIVFIVNITAALGYAMLMNSVTSSQDRYTPGVLTSWLVSSAILIFYGVYYGAYKPKDYALRVILLSITASGIVASLLRILGAVNFASGFPTGITMAIVLIQVW